MSRAHDRSAYLITDPNFIITQTGADVAWLGQLGVVSGQSLVQIIPALAADKPKFQQVLAGRTPQYALEFTLRNAADTQLMHYCLTATPLKNAAGEITSLLHCIEAVTTVNRPPQIDLEQEVQHLRDYLQIFKYMMDMIAHDLSTPVTLLSGYLDLLQVNRNFAPESEAGGYIKIMTNMVERLMLLINDLADLSQAEAGKLQLNLQITDVDALIRELALEFRPSLLAKHQVLSIETAGELPMILCDVPRFSQIVNNLFSNASKYSPEASEINVKIKLAPQADFLQISIRDTGAGIASTDLENIFKRHYRTAEAERSSVRGAGLGLYIVRLLIELHGGKIWCESTPGVGSTFHFTLPTTSELLDQPAYSNPPEQAYLYRPVAASFR